MLNATLIDREDAILIAHHAIVARGALVWPNGITPTQKAAAEAQLTFLGVLVRDSA
ncbi:head decoration protein [Thauera mechernichensis]